MTENMQTEWAVQYRTNAGGNFDRTYLIESKSGNPYTQETAHTQAATFNAGKLRENQCRVASREVTRWTEDKL